MKNSEISLNVPKHVGFIMDGNRRWAKERGLMPFKGHEAGVDALERVADACFARGVEYLSAFTFSTENWSRTQEEVSFLMGLVTTILTKKLQKFHKKGIRIVVLGSKSRLALCFNYGGTQEIVDMVKAVVASGVDVDKLTPSDLQKYVYHPEIPPCDLIVRTSGEHRASGFMLPRSDYAEFIFDDTFWPDIDESHVAKYIEEFSSRQRRFGK